VNLDLLPSRANSLKNDPTADCRRISVMMLDASRTDMTEQALPPLPPGIGGAVGSRQRRVGSLATTDETDWAALLVKLRDHQDRAAFAALFRHFAPRVKAFLMKSGAGAALAEECAQDVMATLWQKAHLFDPARAGVATWVYTIARNRRIDALRKARRAEPEELDWGPEPEPDQAEALEAQQETERLGRALAALPAPQRTLIERAFYGDLSHSEIAAETGLPLGTIKSRIRLALDKLRHQLG
jgi:RNA polymerase sigma-70 factor (ECF subfamily)